MARNPVRRAISLTVATASVLGVIFVVLSDDEAIASEWKSIKASDNRIVFYPQDAQSPSLKHSSKDWDDTYSYRSWYLGMSGSAKEPRLQVWFADLAGGRHFPTFRTPKDLIMKYEFFKNKSSSGQLNGNASTAVSSTPYVKFSVDQRSCLVFDQTFGQSYTMTTSEGTMRLGGYYCTAEGSTLSDSEISNVLARLGVKDVAVPNASLRTARETTDSNTDNRLQNVRALEDRDVCNFAVRKTANGVEWDNRATYSKHIKIAKERGLTLAQCGVLAGHSPSLSTSKEDSGNQKASVEDRL